MQDYTLTQNFHLQSFLRLSVLSTSVRSVYLAEATGSCSRTIGRIERGERNPSLEMAIRLAHYLNVTMEDIFQLDDDNTPV